MDGSTSPNIVQEHHIEAIPLGRLSLHDDNVRKTPHLSEDIDELKASIVAVGLLTPLVAVITSAGIGEECGTYGVIAGGQRLAALNALAEESKLPQSLKDNIPCVVVDRAANATEISLIENTMRCNMTAADQIEAWGKLASAGMDVDIIASRFGVSTTLVRQRLALANVIPEVLALLREEKIGVDTVQAFTLTDDPERQRAVLAELGDSPAAFQVRKILSQNTLTARDKHVRFVGLETYKDAGGKVTYDLFNEDGTLIHDEELLEKLVMERLEAERERHLAEGWAWVSIDEEERERRCHRDLSYRCPDPGEATPEEQSRMEEIEAMLENDDDDYTKLQEEYNTLEDTIHSRASWPEELKAQAGVFLSIDHNGSIRVDGAWVPYEKPKSQGASGEAAEGTSSAPKALYSGAMRETLANMRTQTIKATLLTSSGLCNDIIAFNLAREVVSSHHGGKIGTIGIAHSQAHIAVNPEYPLFEDLEAAAKALDQSWTESDTQAEAFAAFRALSDEAKQAWINYAVAMSITRVSLSLNACFGSVIESIVSEMVLDWHTLYRPGKEYFSRLTKSAMLETMRPVLGDDWVDLHSGDKKGVLVEVLAEVVAGNRGGLTPQQQAAVEAWSPPGLAPVEDEEVLADEVATDSEASSEAETEPESETDSEAETSAPAEAEAPADEESESAGSSQAETSAPVETEPEADSEAETEAEDEAESSDLEIPAFLRRQAS